MSSELAILGGAPVLDGALRPYVSIGAAERDAVLRVLASGTLSGFYGNWGPHFLGGQEVKCLENQWMNTFGVQHAISVNSNTSGLYAAMAALEISPGDEVIVPPLSMSASVMAPLMYGGIPVFADVESSTFCLAPRSVEANITPRTRAVIAVNLFGHPAPLGELSALCRRYGLALVEDNAQAPLASEFGRLTGTIGDIGVFSLNYHKHIHSGEGGVCTTNDERLAARMQAVRNHAENIVEPGNLSPVNMLGHNWRMTEITAAIASTQLSRLHQEVAKRRRIAESLSQALQGLEGIVVPQVRTHCDHSYYLWVMRVVEEELGVSRDRFVAALNAEGFPVVEGYTEPLYNLPAFRRRIALGRDGWPFTLTERDYRPGLCPVAEVLHDRQLAFFETCAYDVQERDLDRLIEAFYKVHSSRHQLTT